MTLPNPTYQELLAERKQRYKNERRDNQVSNTIWSFVGFLFIFLLFSFCAMFTILGVSTFVTHQHLSKTSIEVVACLYNVSYWLIVLYMFWHFISNTTTIWERELDVMIKGARKALKDNDL